MTIPTSTRGAAAAASALMLTLALTSTPASAHGKLESAVPAAGSTVDTAPDALQLTFNEDLEPAFSSAKVSNAGGAPVNDAKASIDAARPRTMRVAVPALEPGTYTVRWSVMTADAHRTKGTYTFTVKR